MILSLLNRIRNRIFLTLIIFTLPSLSFAAGLGAQLNVNPGITINGDFLLFSGAAFTVKLDKDPIILNISTDYNIVNNLFEGSVGLDYWLINPAINEYCNFFLGLGVGYGIDFNLSEFYLESMKRIVLGFNWILYDGFMEPFIQLSIQNESRINLNLKSLISFNAPVSAGIRFYY